MGLSVRLRKMHLAIKLSFWWSIISDSFSIKTGTFPWIVLGSFSNKVSNLRARCSGFCTGFSWTGWAAVGEVSGESLLFVTFPIVSLIVPVHPKVVHPLFSCQHDKWWGISHTLQTTITSSSLNGVLQNGHVFPWNLLSMNNLSCSTGDKSRMVYIRHSQTLLLSYGGYSSCLSRKYNLFRGTCFLLL